MNPANLHGRRITVVEVGPRDGLQNERVEIPTDDKIELVNLLSAANLQRPGHRPIACNRTKIDLACRQPDGAPRETAAARGLARSGSSPNSSSPAIIASCESTIAGNHSGTGIGYTQG